MVRWADRLEAVILWLMNRWVEFVNRKHDNGR